MVEMRLQTNESICKQERGLIMIESVTMYKCSDETVFKSPVDAFKHEQRLIISVKLEKFIDNHFYNGISKDRMHGILMQNVAELREILNTA